jgi:lysophospholipase L1-like esterase
MIDDLSKRMQTGCFMQTAFGLVDPAKSVAIFGSTDEAQYIKYGGQPAALSILPYSASVARFGGFPGLGTYMYLYTYFPNALTDEGIPIVGRYKSITAEPNFTVRGPDNLPLPVNSTALAFAPRGQWMVTESPAHALVRINLADFSILPFAPSFYLPDMPYASHAASMAITGDGRYAAVASAEFSSFKVYDLKNCTPANSDDALAPHNCQSYNYWPYIKSQVAGSLERITHVSFLQDGLLSFTAVTSIGNESYVLAPSDSIDSLLPYLGLGDSYASGQGAWNYLSGTDTAINKCHLSSHSYPLRLNGDIYSNGGHSVSCSGARITDIINQSPEYAGQVNDHHSAKSREADDSEVGILHDFLPGYIAQNNFVTTYQPKVVTVQIGGNDIGFKDFLLRCVSPLSSVKPPTPNPSNCFSSYEDRLEIEQTITRNYSKWVSLYKELHRAAPASHIYAIGYPQIIASSGSCGFNVRLSSYEAGFARELVTYLNSVIQKAATAGGVQYVDITDALVGHELCAGQSAQPAMNGITAGSDTYGILGQESFHPTAFGHDLIEQSILRATHNLTAYSPATPNTAQEPPSPSNSDTLLQAPKTGRPVKTIAPVSDMATNNPDGSLTISLNGLTYGIKPGAIYTVSVGGVVCGSVQSDERGRVQITFSTPASAGTGQQTVSLDGLSQDGHATTIIEVIYIPATPTDYDGDSILNTQDSCPAVADTKVDSDEDGIDDGCDTIIARIVPLQLSIIGIVGRASYYWTASSP